MQTTHLPIDSQIPKVLQALQTASNVIVSAEPGTGKTTRLPPALLSCTDKQIWILEPRRIAAIASASRIAQERNWQVGNEVGYQVRFEQKKSARTKLLFMTEALLLKKLLHDPDLSEVGVVVLDEFHERSLHTDLALAALRELQILSRPDLKIIVMSATLNIQSLTEYLPQAIVVEVPGKTYSLKIHYEDKGQLLQTGFPFIDRMRKLVQKAARNNHQGDLLCFLPGKGEIERLRTELADWSREQNIEIMSLHGSLNLDAQRKVLMGSELGRRLILTTNVAESSLTVPKVKIVIDSGLARIAQLHPRTGFASLDLVRVSKASAKQRAGRAARTSDGEVYRAWTPYDENSMRDFETAEIHRVDLAESFLLLAELGIKDYRNFSWFESPLEKNAASAVDLLRALEATDNEGNITSLGKEILRFPVHPRLGKVLLSAVKNDAPESGARLAALLEERDDRPIESSEYENDILLKYEAWKSDSSHPKYTSLNRTYLQLCSLLHCKGEDFLAIEKFDRFCQDTLLEVFSDRLCRRRKAREPQAKMVGGRGVKLHEKSSVKTSEYFLAITLLEGRDQAETLVQQAVGIAWEKLEHTIGKRAQRSSELLWDEEKMRFNLQTSLVWKGLSVGPASLRPARSDEMQQLLAQVVWQRWDWVVAHNAELNSWLERVYFLQGALSPLTDDSIKQAIEAACVGESSLEKFTEKNLIPYFSNLLNSETRKKLESECPQFWQVPSGTRIPIQYTKDQGPKVEVRLQELFGLQESPSIRGTKLTLVLLSPNFRPVQVTRDLASFWKTGYEEVRKELRSRYPKHSWPDNPLLAKAEAKGKPRR